MTSRPRRRLEANKSKIEILDAAEQRFAELGYEATRLEDVAKDIGLGRSGVLYHFSTKEKLYRAVLEYVYGDYAGKVTRVLAGSGSLAERIEATIGFSVDEVCKRPSIAQIAIREASAIDSDFVSLVRLQAKPFMGLLRNIFEEGEKTGELNPVNTDPYILLSSISGTVIFYVNALPRFFGALPDNHMAPERFEILKMNILKSVKTMLGIDDNKT